MYDFVELIGAFLSKSVIYIVFYNAEVLGIEIV